VPGLSVMVDVDTRELHPANAHNAPNEPNAQAAAGATHG
jgi:hypothetical protein